jgi:6-phosphogluconolactonase
MGADAHTASLFPHTPALEETERWVVAQYVDKMSMWRITLTAEALNAAAYIIFLISGENKAPALREVLQGEYNPAEYPAQLIAPTDGKLLWLVDAEAASLLVSNEPQQPEMESDEPDLPEIDLDQPDLPEVQEEEE